MRKRSDELVRVQQNRKLLKNRSNGRGVFDNAKKMYLSYIYLIQVMRLYYE